MAGDGDDVDWALSGRSIGSVVLGNGVMITEPFGAAVRAARWRGDWVQLVDTILCARAGTIEIELLSPVPAARAAVDVRPVEGHIELPDGHRVKVLRTWHDRGLAPRVDYPYRSRGERIHVSFGYEVTTRAGSIVFETRSAWAGFRVERPSRWERVYRCSLGAPGVDFDGLIFRVRVQEHDRIRRRRLRRR